MKKINLWVPDTAQAVRVSVAYESPDGYRLSTVAVKRADTQAGKDIVVKEEEDSTYNPKA